MNEDKMMLAPAIKDSFLTKICGHFIHDFDGFCIRIRGKLRYESHFVDFVPDLCLICQSTCSGKLDKY